MTRAREILTQLSTLLTEYKLIIEQDPVHPQQSDVIDEFLFVARNLAQMHGTARRDIARWRQNVLNTQYLLHGTAINGAASVLANNLVIMRNNYKGKSSVIVQPDKFEL